jgi:hypothetical protein
VAAAFAAILLIAVQTDAFGIPWLAYVLWWLAGALTASLTGGGLRRAKPGSAPA